MIARDSKMEAGMRQRFARIIAVAALGTFVALVAGSASAKTAKECDDEYAANKAAIQAAKEKKADFISACKALATGQTTPIGAATPAAAPASPPPAPKSPPPAAAAPAGNAATGVATGTNEFSTEAQAKAKCPSGTVVWVNLKSKIYHFAGNKDYGTTKEGTYMCESDATAAGDRAAKNEKHP
jgi:hypothetical protein